MPVAFNNNTDLSSLESKFRNAYDVSYNGLSGIDSWECYMLIKYGNQYNFGVSGENEYLVQLPVYPEQVTESIDVNWGKQDILGRSSPISAYGNTSLKNVHFTLNFHRDLLTGSYSLKADRAKTLGYKGGEGVNDKSQLPGYQRQAEEGPFGTRTWYVNINKMLQMACYPQYTNNGLIPPTTYFIFGQMILKGFLVSYSTTWKTPIINSFYSNNSVDINMDCYPDTIISAKDIINGNTSTQNTYNTKFPSSNASNSDVGARLYNGEIKRGNLRTNSSLGGTPIQT